MILRPLLLALAYLQLASPVVDQSFFRYQRAVQPASDDVSSAVPVCATLDGAVYAHSSPSLKDLRLYQGTREVPYAITLSEAAQADSEPAKVINSGMVGSHIFFDLEMPTRPYTDVTLDLDAHDFLATATVNALEDADPPALVRLGSFTLFDLTSQHLSRSTTLHLQESTFRKLRIELDLRPAPGTSAELHPNPGMVRGATVPPSREAQTLYTSVAEATSFTQQGRKTIAHIHLPAHVPVESIAFALPPDYTGNFSRTVEIAAHTQNSPATAVETVPGTIQRVRMGAIHQEQLTMPATIGANLQQDAEVTVAIDNGNDEPIPLSAVRLEMRERKLCFPAIATTPVLFYGDPALDAPVYDFARLLSLARGIHPASLGPEQLNPAYRLRPPPPRALTERYPQLLWVALLIVVGLLGAVALSSARHMQR
ncbi:MAG TPA: hypothetical protein VGC07_01595 [Granulicella sp.]